MTALEGIIIRKVPTKARDLVCLLLLRSGKILTVYCYGGQGGGRHHKGTILELGHMVRIHVTPSKKYISSDMPSSREWSLIWESSAIRTDINAFYLACFIFELVAKIAIAQDTDDDENNREHEGIFSVVSNAIYYLDQSIKEYKTVDVQNQLSLFLVKLLGQLGILPDHTRCIHCHVDLKNMGAVFGPEHGGFTCINCLEQTDNYISRNVMMQRQIQDSSCMREMLKTIPALSYKEYFQVKAGNREVVSLLFNHLCYQFHLHPADFKTKSILF